MKKTLTPGRLPAGVRDANIPIQTVESEGLVSSRNETSAAEPPPATNGDTSPYSLPPTYPSPYVSAIEQSLDTALKDLPGIAHILVQPPSREVIWAALLQPFIFSGNPKEFNAVQELLFVITRTLLPNQVAENRALMAELYRGNSTPNRMKFLLRYDMLFPWKRSPGPGGNPYSVESVAPTDHSPAPVAYFSGATEGKHYRRPLSPNVISTLIQAPVEGWRTDKTRKNMKHHVTRLDDLLLLTDETVEGWGPFMLQVKICAAIMLWMDMRINNQKLDDMRVKGWEELKNKEDDGEELVWYAS